MSDKTFRILGEETIRRTQAAAGAENPYWGWEELPPHPDPSKGCVRRGLCCKSSPGWFAPGEVEGAASLLGVEADALVRERLIIDSVEVDGERVFAFAPVKLGRDGAPAIPPATRADALYRALRGVCTFYDEGEGCTIYRARPYECRGYVCTNDPEDNPSHQAIARLWREASR
ncbi:MAG: hypothetical protein CSA66_02525 [Proteobacteria bacterium]|nr:MAG: hypothetical protein CSA66_02525 [Pseudomonadota bacterium]